MMIYNCHPPCIVVFTDDTDNWNLSLPRPQFCCFPQMAENLMSIAYENGVNLFDTAEVYASGRWDVSLSFKHCFLDVFLLTYLFPISVSTHPLWRNVYACSGFSMKCLHVAYESCYCAASWSQRQLIRVNDVPHRAEITLGSIIKKKGWRWYILLSELVTIPNNSLFFWNALRIYLFFWCWNKRSIRVDRWAVSVAERQ